jgi:hypothetical protein
MPRNQKSGAAKRRRRRDTLENDAHQWVVHRTDAREFFPVLVPQDIIDQIFSPANLPDPADLANLTAVNRGIRDAVVATGRKVEELNSVKAAELGCLRTLQCLLRQGRLEKSLVCSAAARGGHLEELKWGIAEGCQYAEETHAAAASSGNLAVLQYLHGKGCRANTKSCAAAALNGHLHVLKWLREASYRWEENMLVRGKRRASRVAAVGALERLPVGRESAALRRF